MTTQVRQFPNKIYAPPGGWRYKVPETGQTFRGASEYQLTMELQAHYRANQLKLPDDLSTRIEQFVCEQEPDYCTDSHGQPIRDGRKSWFTSIHTALTGTRTLGAWALAGLPMVEQADADRRSATCATCPMHIEPEGCTNCNVKEIGNLVELLVGKRRTSHHDTLKACKVCDCFLRVKCWLPHTFLWERTSEAQRAAFPANCWLKTESTST